MAEQPDRAAAGDALRILFDAYWLVDGPPSGRAVVASLVATWYERYPGDRVKIALPSADLTVDLPGDIDVQIVPPRVRRHGLWAQYDLGRATVGQDVVVAQNFTPRTVAPGVVRATYVHDVLFLDHPEWFTPLERAYLSMIGRSARRTDVVLTSSHSERNRIARRWPWVADRLRATGLAVPRALMAARAQRPTALATDARPFILAVGRLNVRKNLGRLVEAYRGSAELRARYELLIVGESNGRTDGAPEQDEGVRYLGRVGDPELRWLYENCTVYCFPTLGEGFGLPLLEARMFASPIAASRIPVFEELGLADALFDPASVTELRAALESLARLGRAAAAPAPEGLSSWGRVVDTIRDAIRERVANGALR